MKLFADRSGITLVILPVLLLLLASCGGDDSPTPSSAIDLEPFKALAKDSGCSDKHNRLFVIDETLVFWDKAGDCPDGSYSQTLYQNTTDQVLCTLHDSIAGPMEDCSDEQYQEIFATITANLEEPDLGLGAEHSVQAIDF